MWLYTRRGGVYPHKMWSTLEEPLEELETTRLLSEADQAFPLLTLLLPWAGSWTALQECRSLAAAGREVWLLLAEVWLLLAEVWLLPAEVWLLLVEVWLLLVEVWLLLAEVWLLLAEVWLLLAEVWLLLAEVWLLLAEVWLLLATTDEAACSPS